jgi:hypothetical protein
MKYELFQASAVKAFGHCRDIKAMVSDMQGVLSVVPAMVRKNERLDRERAELKQENAALKAELDDWKGNAEGFEPDAYMRLSLDADGVPIRIGDESEVDGDAMTVLGYRFHNDMLLIIAKDKESGLVFTPRPSGVRHFRPEPPDSWEKLEEDVSKNPCSYFGKLEDQNVSCLACPHGHNTTGRNCGENMNLDLIERAKKLAGIEEQEGE